MDRDGILKIIAEAGYNVGFGAKKHFATYDIVEKAPGIISFFSIAFGVYSLAFSELSIRFLSALFTVLGVVGVYIQSYDSKKSEYESSGIALTRIFNELNRLYNRAKISTENDFSGIMEELREIEGRYYGCCISKQILFSDWYAHYKFFWQHQIEWVNEQKRFRLFRDKVPLSFVVFVLLVFAAFGCWFLGFSGDFCAAVAPEVRGTQKIKLILFGF